MRFEIGFIALLALGLSVSSYAALPLLSLRAIHEISSEPLTTEKVAELDPAQPNPQLRRWVLNRKMQIQNWQSRKIPGGFVGVSGGVLEAASLGYLRPPGPWYNTDFAFPCEEKSPDPSFATEQGSRDELNSAVGLWEDVLGANKLKLAIELSHVEAANEKSAWLKADRVFEEWLVDMDREWRARVQSEIVPKQWKAYRAEALKGDFCMKKKKLAEKKVFPDEWMDQGLGSPSAPPRSTPLTRAPSRRWDGFFAIRMDVGVGNSDAMGQMLTDPATPRSVLAPEWMISQGLRPEWIEIPEARPMPVKVFAGAGVDGLGKAARVGFAKISEYPVALLRYLLADTTEIFDEPDEMAPCCSGVLGIDLFRRYALEFQGGVPAAVQLWQSAGYHPPADYQWVEARESPGGKLTAICSDRIKGLSVEAGHARNAYYDLQAKLCQDPRHALEEATHTIVFDLPHGKIWYSPEELHAPEYKNQSGLKLSFTYLKADRVLEVTSLKDTPVSHSLIEAGLKRGMIITEVDGISTAELDLWDVNRRLAGVYGDTVKLKWVTPKGYQIEPLKLIQKTYLKPNS